MRTLKIRFLINCSVMTFLSLNPLHYFMFFKADFMYADLLCFYLLHKYHAQKQIYSNSLLDNM